MSMWDTNTARVSQAIAGPKPKIRRVFKTDSKRYPYYVGRVYITETDVVVCTMTNKGHGYNEHVRLANGTIISNEPAVPAEKRAADACFRWLDEQSRKVVA